MATAQGLEDELKTRNMYTCQEGSVRLVCQPFKTECRPDPLPELNFLTDPHQNRLDLVSFGRPVR